MENMTRHNRQRRHNYYRYTGTLEGADKRTVVREDHTGIEAAPIHASDEPQQRSTCAVKVRSPVDVKDSRSCGGSAHAFIYRVFIDSEDCRSCTLETINDDFLGFEQLKRFSRGRTVLEIG